MKTAVASGLLVLVSAAGLADLFLIPPNLRYSHSFQEMARLARLESAKAGPGKQ